MLNQLPELYSRGANANRFPSRSSNIPPTERLVRRRLGELDAA
jgi:hypothetical protein